MELTEIFKALSDNTRVRIFHLLSKSGILCNCNIESILEISQVNASRHLSKLKSVKLVKAEKKAQWVYYSINDEFVSKYPFLGGIFSDINVEEELKKDEERLNEYLITKSKCGG